tara:strand:+ start:600 stop:1283 length:684 start_codon:yes stop_codon:yes gene_type:complete
MALTKYNYNSFDVTSAASQGLVFNSTANGFTTAAKGSMVLIKTITITSGTANATFVNGSSDVVFDNTYPLYIFKVYDVHPATDNEDLTVNFTTDGSNFNVSKQTTFWDSYHYEGDNQSYSGVGITAAKDLALGTGGQCFIKEIAHDNDNSGTGHLYVFNPSNTTFVKHFNSYSIAFADNDAADGGWIQDGYMSGYCNTSSAITGVRFAMSSGNIDTGIFKLYGVKDS